MSFKLKDGQVKKWFSVNREMNICGVIRRPAIRYNLPKNIEKIVEGLVANGKAVIYDTPVIFVNGTVLSSTYNVKTASEVAASSVASYTSSSYSTKKKRSK